MRGPAFWGLGWVAICGGLLGCAPAAASFPASSHFVGRLFLDCQPEDARVFLDSVEQGACADFTRKKGGLITGVGAHRIEVRKAGFLPFTSYYEPNGAYASLGVALTPAGNRKETGP